MVWTNEVTTQIRSKNHKYSALTCKDQSYYQSMSSKFRYGDRKVLGTNPTRPVGQLPVIVSYFLISLKTHLTLLSILTHTLAYIQQSIWHQSSQNPNIHLSRQLTSSLAYIYHAYHIISSNAANNKISQGQKHRHGNIKETCDCILDIKNTSSNQACSTHH